MSLQEFKKFLISTKSVVFTPSCRAFMHFFPKTIKTGSSLFFNVKTEKATFAAGCFWGVEEAFRRAKGVTSTTVGYTGGKMKNPSYDDVCSDETGHAEAVQIEFDPKKVPYEKLLDIFWKNHDPTQLNRQGPDIGSQYRSAVFFHNEKQRKAAIKSKEAVEKSKKYSGPVATEIVPASDFYKAEEYHQKYLEKRGMNVCH